MKETILDTVGSPLVELDVGPAEATVAAKLEFYNPSMSGKAQPAIYMVEAAEREGLLTEGDTIVEPTSGNTGIALAMIGAVKNYNVTLVLPNGASHERKCIMRAYGATIEEVDGGLDAACNRADELEKQGAVQLRQFSNTANPQSHYEITGPDIVEQVGDRTIDAFVAGTGTGGTISGMGPSFLPDTFDQDLLDGVETVELAAAHSECRRLAERGGILVGPSSGASAIGAKRVATALEEDGVDNPLVITTFWDSGERYLSTGIFEPDYDC